MAKELHYSYFKGLYDEESRRSVELNDNAKTNTTLVALYGAFIALALDKGKIPVNFDRYLFILAIACLFLSIVISLYASKIADFEVPNYPRDVLVKLPEYNQDDERFYEDRIIDLTAAYEANSEINDRKVDWLTAARLLLLAGIAMHFAYCVTLMFS